MRSWYLIASVVWLALISGCEPTGLGDTTPRRQEFITLDPPTTVLLSKPEEALTFARLAPGVEAEVQQASFWAVSGQRRTLAVRYAGQLEGAPLLEFEVGELSLLTYPDGIPVLPGDSVQITVTLDPARRLVFDFQPAGLVFSPLSPARLRVNYAGADDDINGDGLINFLDGLLLSGMELWRQDLPGLPWVEVPTLKLPEIDILEGAITHFTGFAMAT